jgi:hypothetical protein
MDLAAENGEHDAARLWMGRGSRGGELVAGTSGISRLPPWAAPGAVAGSLCRSDGVQHRSAVRLADDDVHVGGLV